MSTVDQLSLSSCKVICLCDKYYAKVSTAEPVALFLSLLMMTLTIIMCSSISNPNFLLQRPFAHGTESCIESSAFLKSFALFIFLIKKVAVLTTQCLLYHGHYDCVQTCKQPLARQEFGWVSSLFCYICP